MMKIAVCALAVCMILVVVLAATKGQVISMATSGFGRLIPAGPSTLFDDNRVHDLDVVEPFTVLAAGDIANCETGRSLDRAVRNLRYSVGLSRPEPTANEDMIMASRIIEANPDALVFALRDLAYGRGEPVALSDCYDPF